MQAEGYFRTQFRRKPVSKNKAALGYSIFLRVIFTQNQGDALFHKIKSRFHTRSVTHHRKTTRLTISSQQYIALLVAYFQQFSLFGRKKIAQHRWIRLYNCRKTRPKLPPESSLEYRRFVRLIYSVNFCQNRSPRWEPPHF